MALLPTSAQDLITRLPFVAQTGPDTRSQLVQALTGAINQGREQKVAQQLGAATTAAVSGTATDEQLGLLFQRDPAAALKVLEGAGAVSAQGRDRLAQTAFSIQGLQPDQQTAAIQQVVQQIQQSGGDPSAWVNMLQGSPEQRDEALRGIQQASLSVKQRGEIGEADRQFGLQQQQFGLKEQLTGAQIGNIRSQIASRQANQALNQQKFQQAQVVAQNAINAGVQIDAKGRRSINSDITGLIKESVAIQGAAKSLEGLEKLGSAAARLAAVFKFMKALDPTSVVRETEQGQVYAASGAASQLAGQLNSILGKGKLTDAGFKDLVGTSKNIANSSLNSATGSVNSYLNTFEDTLPNSFKSRLTNRVPDLFVVPRAQPAAPDAAGTAQITPAPAAAPTTIGRFQVEVLN